MKKLAILFLLTAVFIGFTFGQVSIKGDFGLNNVLGTKKGSAAALAGAEGALVPVFKVTANASAEKELGPGSIGMNVELQYVHMFSSKLGDLADQLGDNSIEGYYALAAGPGTLKFRLKEDALLKIEIGADYDGFAAGPATLGFGAWYVYAFEGFNDSFESAAFGRPGQAGDQIGLRVSAGFEFGLNIVYKFVYELNDEKYASGKKSGIAEIAKLDITYKINDAITVGVETENTGLNTSAGKNYLFEGFTIKPKAEYTISDNTVAGLYIALDNVLANKDHVGDNAKDIVVTPGIWIKHTF